MLNNYEMLHNLHKSTLPHKLGDLHPHGPQRSGLVTMWEAARDSDMKMAISISKHNLL